MWAADGDDAVESSLIEDDESTPPNNSIDRQAIRSA